MCEIKNLVIYLYDGFIVSLSFNVSYTTGLDIIGALKTDIIYHRNIT